MILRYRPYSLELREPFGTAYGTRTHTDGMIVALEFEGVVGYGEVFMPPYYPENQNSMAEFFSKVDAGTLLASDRPEKALDYVQSLAVGNDGAKTALDIALHDLFGKQQNIPVHRWITDNVRSAARHPAPIPRNSIPTSYTIGIDTIETMVRKAKAAQEFKTLKIKLNGKNDIEVIEAIREITDQQLFVDANQGWKDVDNAIRTSERLVALGVGLIEQPFPRGEAEKAGKLKAKSAVPVVADEDVQTLDDIENLAGFYDGINIKLMKAGGVREAHRMITAARKYDLKVLLGCMTESSIGISAAAQLAHLADWCDLDGNLLIKNDTCTGVETVDGRLIPTDTPGIGITDDSKLKEIFETDK